MSKLDEILEKYDKGDYQLVHDTVDELCKNGVGKGCFQDYTVLCDVIEVLSFFENLVKNKEEQR